MTLIGYARVSTAEQNLELQKDALAKTGCEEVFEDHVSGAKTERPGLAEALRFARHGDTLVVWKLDRLGRSMAHLIETVRKLETKSVGFRSLTKGWTPRLQAERWSSTFSERWRNSSGTSSASAPAPD